MKQKRKRKTMKNEKQQGETPEWTQEMEKTMARSGHKWQKYDCFRKELEHASSTSRELCPSIQHRRKALTPSVENNAPFKRGTPLERERAGVK